MLPRMIGAAIGRVNTMVGSEKDRISRSHDLLHLCEPRIYITQCLGIPLTISAVAPQHIKFYQVDKEQPFKVTFQPVKRSIHALAIGFSMVALRQATPRKKVLDLAKPDDFLAVIFQQVKQSRPQWGK